jgi:hypothetical protein
MAWFAVCIGRREARMSSIRLCQISTTRSYFKKSQLTDVLGTPPSHEFK